MLGAVAAQEQPGTPRLLVAHRGGRVPLAAHDVPGAHRELVHAAVRPAASDGPRVVARLAPGDAAQLLLAPPRHGAPHLELEHRVAAPERGAREASPAPLHPVDGTPQLPLRRRPRAPVGGAHLREQVTTDVEVLALQPRPPALIAGAEAPRRLPLGRIGLGWRERRAEAGARRRKGRSDQHRGRERARAGGKQKCLSHFVHAPQPPHTGQWPAPSRASSAAARASCSASGAAAGSPVPPTVAQVS
jgi:hypothetical protein